MFEKIITPLVIKNITTIDLTGAAGFVDSYTEDPDKPSGDSELFLMYEMNIHNEFTESRAIRLSQHPYLKRDYVKHINGKAYHIYSFFVPPSVKKFYNGILQLNSVEKFKVLNFWNMCDSTLNKMMDLQVLSLSVNHQMPLDDYVAP